VAAMSESANTNKQNLLNRAMKKILSYFEQVASIKASSKRVSWAKLDCKNKSSIDTHCSSQMIQLGSPL
jgi:hypothetical protein